MRNVKHLFVVTLSFLVLMRKLCHAACPPPAKDGSFALLGSETGGLRHYELRCNNGYHVYPARGDTILTCRGNEPNPVKRVTASCSQRSITCLAREFKCQIKQSCIPKLMLCDGTPDCADETDESNRVCGVNNNCKPKPDWFQRFPNAVFSKMVSHIGGLNVYRVGCKDGYEMEGNSHDEHSPQLHCRHGRVFRQPDVTCIKTEVTQTCGLPSLEYQILNYHDELLDLDADSHSELQPGTILTVRCSRTGVVATAYCKVTGELIGVPPC